MRRLLPRPISALVVLAALVPVGCGGENPAMLTSADASRLTSTVDSVGNAVADGECVEALARVQELRVQVASLPARVSTRLRARLQEGVEHLQTQVPAECQEATVPTPTPTEAPVETPTPEATPAPTEAPTETPTPPVETPTVPPDTGGGTPEGGEAGGASNGQGKGRSDDKGKSDDKGRSDDGKEKGR